MIHCIALDDEPKALEIIKHHAIKVPSLSLDAAFTDVYQALKFIDNHAPDLIFLDINMPDINGLQFAQALRTKPLLIFTTAHNEYAIQSYEVEAVDYLLKPFDFARFLQAARRAEERFCRKAVPEKDFFFLKIGNQHQQRVFFHEIYYIEGEGNYVSYITKTGNYLARGSLKNALLLLPSTGFVQVHRSFVVAIRNIEKVENNHVYTGKEKIPIGSTYRETFFKLIETSHEKK